jgi:Mg2+/Co2+ transporter CorB
VFTQLQYFQENKERLGIIVDEYGEVQGLVTLDDIIEEMIGDFTTSMPGAARADAMAWNAKGECLLEGSTPLRDINKKLGLDLPLDGPKTVNGLLLEQLQEIPDAPIALKMGGMRDRSGAGAESVNQSRETVASGCQQKVAGGLKSHRKPAINATFTA